MVRHLLVDIQRPAGAFLKKGMRLAMNGLTTDLLSRACRIFLELAYPGGEQTMAPSRRPFFAISPDQPLNTLLTMSGICQPLHTPEGALRGYAFRLGSVRFPHIKLQVISHNGGASWIFSVDTHDILRCSVSGEEAKGWAELQAENRQLKERIEQEWDKHGLLTFNRLLRNGLEKRTS
jgi:hypothetical protein